jgi:hypothetical protein
MLQTTGQVRNADLFLFDAGGGGAHPFRVFSADPGNSPLTRWAWSGVGGDLQHLQQLEDA